MKGQCPESGSLWKGLSFVEVSLSFDISLTHVYTSSKHLGRDKHMALKSPSDLIIRGSPTGAALAAPVCLGRFNPWLLMWSETLKTKDSSQPFNWKQSKAEALRFFTCSECSMNGQSQKICNIAVQPREWERKTCHPTAQAVRQWDSCISLLMALSSLALNPTKPPAISH